METRDETVPGDRWEFDDDVTAVFDDMLERSIPQYEVMRSLVTEVAAGFVPRGVGGAGHVLDLGTSRGEVLSRLRDKLGANARYWGVEMSPPMVAAARDRFAGSPDVEIIAHDLRAGYPDVPPMDVTLAVLTVQFTPIEHRLRILRDVYLNTRPGGAFVLVEKVLGATADLNARMVDVYHGLKGENGYSPEQIERKRLSLEGVLVPVTARWNVDALEGAGFHEIDCVWRWANFAAWLAVRA